MDLDEIRAFLAVVDTSSLSVAAETIGIPRTTLRRRLETLEARLGAPVLVREGRQVAVTPTGRSLVARGRGLLREADRLLADVVATTQDPATHLTALVSIGVHPISSALVVLQALEREPSFQLQVRHLDDPVTALAEEGDFAIYLGLRVPPMPFVARSVGTMPLRLLACRAYADIHGVPASLDDLQQHRLFGWCGNGVEAGTLPLRAGGSIPVHLSMCSENMQISGECARLGAGLGLAPLVHLPGDGWPAEEVVVVLEDEVGMDLPIWFVTPHAVAARPAVQPVVHAIETFLSSVLSR